MHLPDCCIQHGILLGVVGECSSLCACVQEGRLAESEKYYTQALVVAPTHANPYYNIACIKCISKDVKGCLTWLQQAVAVGYNDVDHAERDWDLRLVRRTYPFEWQNLRSKMSSDMSISPGLVWQHVDHSNEVFDRSSAPLDDEQLVSSADGELKTEL